MIRITKKQLTAMKADYIKPLVEIIEIEIEDVVLNNSGSDEFGVQDFEDDGLAW